MNFNFGSGFGRKLFGEVGTTRNKITKIFVWIFGLVFAILLFLFLVGVFGPSVINYFENKKNERISAQIDAEIEARKNVMRNDFAGGKTPEETVDMLLEALKKGDLETAASYYIPDLKEKALAEYKDELKTNGNLNNSINYISDTRFKGTKGCDEQGKGCTFRYKYIYEKETKLGIKGSNDTIIIPKGGSLQEITDMSQNPFTKVWKVDQL